MQELFAVGTPRPCWTDVLYVTVHDLRQARNAEPDRARRSRPSGKAHRVLALRPASALLLGALLLCACATAPQPAATPAPVAPAPVTSGPAGSTYLALGDSVAAGAGAPPGQGYVPLLADLLRAAPGCGADGEGGCPLELVDLSEGGATTTTLLRDQLPEAVQVLASGRQVPVVTVTIGGNDVFEPVVRGCAAEPGGAACRASVDRALAAADEGLDLVLAGVAAAAGPATTVAVMTYYDPVPACVLAPLAPLATVVLEGEGDRPGLNDLLRARAQQHGALVVEAAERLSSPDAFVGGDDCLHPSPAGHRALAAAFADALGVGAGS